MKNKYAGSTWNEVRETLLTPEERRESETRAILISKIIELRKGKGLTQRELAEMADVRQPIIARLERGTCIPRLDTAVKILASLGYKFDIVPDIESKKNIYTR